jgi:hypothetical protein
MSKKEKEIGIPSNAPKSVKKKDEIIDKKHHVREGSPEDLKMDRKIMREAKKKRK